VVVACAGCASVTGTRFAAPLQALPRLEGSYHVVRRGETLWSLSRAFGVSVESLAAANRLPNPEQLTIGQRLFIPLPSETSQFLWPLRGSVQAVTEPRGLEIAAPPGSLVRAARSGHVGVAARAVAGWGSTVVLAHGDGYHTVYSGLNQLLVAPGALVRQGLPIGRLGSGALHFEIRYGAQARDPLALLSAG
jgi:murein DD-endopeptidase MepM/ murein hydrolase activator NlpD